MAEKRILEKIVDKHEDNFVKKWKRIKEEKGRGIQ
jgi:hypothetical protein